MKRRFSPYFPFLFLFVDLLFLNGAFMLANYIRFKVFWFEGDNYPLLCLFINTSWIWIYYLNRLFKVVRESSIIEELNKILISVTIQLALVFTAWFALKSYYYSREHLFYTFLFFTGSLLFWRTALILLLRYVRSLGYNIRSVAIVGVNDIGNYLENHFNKRTSLGYDFLGYFSNDKLNEDKPWLGKVDQIPEYCSENNVDVLFCSIPNLTSEELKRTINFAENNLIEVSIISEFSYFNSKNLVLEKHGEIPVLNLTSIPLDSKFNRFIKRLFDIIFSSLVLIFFMSWLIPLIALLIRIESKGPVFFLQKRHGKGNSFFKCFKFRTMVVNNESDTKQASRTDSRITKVGAILRKTSIDELPQFINVFLGDMSVVGPRPQPIKLNEEFAPKIDKFFQRHAVKPGVTGLAQAKGYRGETAQFFDMYNRVKLDRFYVKNWSLVLDIKIIILTVVSLIKGDENAF